MKDILEKKSKKLKSIIDEYNTYSHFADIYKKTGSLYEYIDFIKDSSHSMTISLNERYTRLIMIYNTGNHQPLLSNLYERILALDEQRKCISDDIRNLLRKR